MNTWRLCYSCNTIQRVNTSGVIDCQQCQPAPVWWPIRQYRALRHWFSRSYTAHTGYWIVGIGLTLYLSIFTMFWVVYLWR